MPASLKELKTRIKSVKSTQQITKAMKLVSAARFGRAQQAVTQARPYAQKLGQLVSTLVSAADSSSELKHPLLVAPQTKIAAVVIVSSERGLAGGYNSSVSKMALATIADLESQGFTVAPIFVGKKALQIVSRKLVKSGDPVLVTPDTFQSNPDILIAPASIVHITSGLDKPTFEMVSRLTAAFTELFEAGRIGRLVLVFNKFQSALTQTPSAETVLPLTAQVSGVGVANTPAILEPDADTLLEAVVGRYVATKVFQTFLESVASEHGARMTAMDNATRNAKDMQRKLEITYQRARQAAITKELIEIISGAEAL